MLLPHCRAGNPLDVDSIGLLSGRSHVRQRTGAANGPTKDRRVATDIRCGHPPRPPCRDRGCCLPAAPGLHLDQRAIGPPRKGRPQSESRFRAHPVLLQTPPVGPHSFARRPPHAGRGGHRCSHNVSPGGLHVIAPRKALWGFAPCAAEYARARPLPPLLRTASEPAAARTMISDRGVATIGDAWPVPDKAALSDPVRQTSSRQIGSNKPGLWRRQPEPKQQSSQKTNRHCSTSIASRNTLLQPAICTQHHQPMAQPASRSVPVAQPAEQPVAQAAPVAQHAAQPGAQSTMRTGRGAAEQARRVLLKVGGELRGA